MLTTASRRQIRILELTAENWTDQELAREFKLSVARVRYLRKHARESAQTYQPGGVAHRRNTSPVLGWLQASNNGPARWLR